MFNWEHFIHLSKELLSKDVQHKEALYRTVVSRAYYGVFKQIEDKLIELEGNKGLRIPDKDMNGRKLGSHERIIFYLKRCEKDKFKELGVKLDDLKRRRYVADYNRDKTISEEDAEKSLEEAQSLNNRWKILEDELEKCAG